MSALCAGSLQQANETLYLLLIAGVLAFWQKSLQRLQSGLPVDVQGAIYTANGWDEAGADFKKWDPNGKSVLDAQFEIRNGDPNGAPYAIATDDSYLYCTVGGWAREPFDARQQTHLARWSPAGKLLWEHFGGEFVSLGNYGSRQPDRFFTMSLHGYRLLSRTSGSWSYCGNGFGGPAGLYG